jgi:2-hydroxy-3-keto-5-methylthiopentenyl-1-phosphate phosphatase
VLQEFGEPGVYERAEAELGRSLTLHEVIALEFLSVRAPLVEVAAWVVENATIRPGFRELVEEHRPVVVSSGFHELIEPLLAREGVEVEVHANRLDARPEGWRVVFRDESACATCGEACKRSALPANGEIVYVGDGYSDRCAALAADRVFATDLLAEYLDERGVGYEPFTDLSDVAQALAR